MFLFWSLSLVARAAFLSLALLGSSTGRDRLGPAQVLHKQQADLFISNTVDERVLQFPLKICSLAGTKTPPSYASLIMGGIKYEHEQPALDGAGLKHEGVKTETNERTLVLTGDHSSQKTL